MSKQFNKQYKLDALKYVEDHPETSIDPEGWAKNLGISVQSLYRWKKPYSEKGENFHRDSGNYASEEQKEIARPKRELRDIKDALDILKKLSAFWAIKRSGISIH